MGITDKTIIHSGCSAPLEHKTIGDIRGSFFVPKYQRGYRWDKNDVTRLLNDLWGSQGEDYNLQPIVVKFHSKGEIKGEDEWELIDGQQRLTTLYLILNFMQQQGWKKMGAPYAIRYDTRPESETYLKTLDKDLCDKNIDFYHIYQANKCIRAWFDEKGDEYAQEDAASTLHSYLFKTVRVIWYKAPDNVDAPALFIRLNVGRIPLTDAELIKAALLSNVRHDSPNRAHEIAAQWDGIERDLHNPTTWAFVAGLAAAEDDETYPTRISLLLDAISDEIDPPRGKRPRYHTFDILREEIDKNFSTLWKKVVALHAQILGWADQPSIYNKIGFLVASGDAFGGIALAAKDKRKSEFETFLVERIRIHINVKDADLEELSYEEIKRGYPKLLQLLFLHNIETSTQFGHHFPFFPHVGKKWSLEHIHAQNSETLNKVEQWRIWLRDHKTALAAVACNSNSEEETNQLINEMETAIHDIESDIDAGRSRRYSREKFNALSNQVLKILNHDNDPDHSIRNMALLSSKHNSSLNNSVFEVKRQTILKLDRKGDYVPVCTRNVFLKYYAKAAEQQPHFWSESDKDSYLEDIRDKLKPYLVEFGQKKDIS